MFFIILMKSFDKYSCWIMLLELYDFIDKFLLANGYILNLILKRAKFIKNNNKIRSEKLIKVFLTFANNLIFSLYKHIWFLQKKISISNEFLFLAKED